MLQKYVRPGPLHILDCACGIGTQSLGLSRLGHQVVGTDLSFRAVARARREAAKRGRPTAFTVADMTDLRCFRAETFDAVLAIDNAIPHVPDPSKAIEQIGFVLKSGGVFIASIRDYDALLSERPVVDPPRFFDDAEGRRIVHQVWDWTSDRSYTLHQYITFQQNGAWRSIHEVSTYYPIRRDELTAQLRGFTDIRWLSAAEAGFYQPVVVARKS